MLENCVIVKQYDEPQAHNYHNPMDFICRCYAVKVIIAKIL